MATKPSLKPITPFDANDGVRLYAQYSGPLPYYNRVVIQDALTMVTVYARTIATKACEHFVDPAYTGSAVQSGDVAYALINGRRYTATIQFFGSNKSTEVGLVSDKKSFLTRTNPIFYFSNVRDGDVIDTSSITLDLVYIQQESEKLSSFKFSIYDNNKTLLQETDVIYDTTNLSYTFKGLDNFTVYYVRAEGITVNGISLDTGYIEIRTFYEAPNSYQRMYVECDKATSEMEYRTNFVLIEADEDDSEFEFEDSWIFLEGKKVTYSKGFNIEGDATWHIRQRDADYKRNLLRCYTSKGEEFHLETLRDIGNTIRYRLTVPGSISNYILYSPRIDVDIPDIIDIWIRKINDVYSLDVYVTKGGYGMGSLYLETTEPTATFQAPDDVWITLNRMPGVEILASDVVVYNQDTEPTTANNDNIWISYT